MLKLKVTELPPHQICLRVDGEQYLISDEKVVAFYSKDGQVYLDETYYRWSDATIKWRNYFLGLLTSQEVEDRIKSGEYILADLN